MRADNSLLHKGVYEFGRFRLNTVERVIASAGRPLSVAPKALDVLIMLVENRGRIVEREELMRRVWPETFVEDNNLAFNISVLRKLFGESGVSPRYIETVPKRGYRFIGEIVEHQQAELPAPEPAPLLTALSQRSPLAQVTNPGRPLIWLTALSIAVVLASFFFLRHRTPKLTDKDTLVLADFTNSTGDPVFDSTLRPSSALSLNGVSVSC